MSQTDRLLTLLRQRGPLGTTQQEWKDKGAVVDGGPAITRIAARVDDLKNAGHDVRHVGTRNGFAVYVLHESPAVAPGTVLARFDHWTCVLCRHHEPPTHLGLCSHCDGQLFRLHVQASDQAARRAA